MTSNLDTAKKLLIEKGFTCVLIKDDITYTSTERGVKPLLSWIEAGVDLKGFFAADKVVGKATAFLYVLAGVKEVYTHVMSEGAEAVLSEYKIQAAFDTCVKNIVNRTKTGMCPMEEAVLDISEPSDALAAIKAKLNMMQAGLKNADV